MFINKTRNILDLNGFNDAAKAISPKIRIVLKLGTDNLRFDLSEALTTEEESQIDDLISNFVDTDPALKVPKIYDYVVGSSSNKHHFAINYKTELTRTLIPKRTIVRGEVQRVEWFASLDASLNPTDKIIDVQITYVRDVTGFAQSRTTTRTWINKDGSDNEEVKITSKYYFINPSDMIDEGLKRRKLLVNNLQMPMVKFMCEVLMPLGYTQQAVILIGRKFMDDYETEMNNFVENSSTITDPADEDFGKKSIVVKIENNAMGGPNADYNLWLDKAPPSLGGLTTIRQYLIAEFSI